MTIYFESYPLLIDQYEEIFIRNQYYFRYEGQSPTVIDAGSNIGMSIIYFKLLYPSCRIIAFEPDEPTFKLLSKMIKTNQLLDVVPHCFALSNTHGKATLYKKNETVGDLNMSMIPGEQTGLIAFPINVVRLSTYVTDVITFVKIDTEGSEIQILEDLIQKDKLHQIQQMVIEFHPAKNGIGPHEFILQLAEQNFTLVEHQKRTDHVLKFIKHRS